ncbi:MAG: hypothetical protein F4Y17_12260 [Gemmatimonadetes bacterium]|nr:hypothetical protein [Gemmatimonadota bacterium]
MLQHVFKILLALFAVLTLMPLYWIVVTAFQTPSVVLAFPPSLVPSPASWINFARLFNGSEIGPWMANSLIETGTVRGGGVSG